MVDSERLPGCRDFRACMSPQVSHMPVTAPRFENTTRNHGPPGWKPRLALVLQVQFQKHECFTCRLMRSSYQFTLHHQLAMFAYRK